MTGHQNVAKRDKWGKIYGSRPHLLPLLLALAPPPTSVQLSPSLARRFLLNIDLYFTSTSGRRGLTNIDSFIKLLQVPVDLNANPAVAGPCAWISASLPIGAKLFWWVEHLGIEEFEELVEWRKINSNNTDPSAMKCPCLEVLNGVEGLKL